MDDERDPATSRRSRGPPLRGFGTRFLEDAGVPEAGDDDSASSGGGAGGTGAASAADAKPRAPIAGRNDASGRRARTCPQPESTFVASLGDLRTETHGRHPRSPPDAADSVTSKIRLSDDAPSPGRAAAVDAVTARNTARAHHAHRAASRDAISHLSLIHI